MGEINWKNKCWVTTIYLVNSAHEVLLCFNKNLKSWAPVGGHMESGETPEESIRREIAEEVGVHFEFYNPYPVESFGDATYVRAAHVQVHPVFHHGAHIAFVFFGKVSEWNDKKTTDEDEKLRWFSEKELVSEKGLLESVRKEALMAARTVKF